MIIVEASCPIVVGHPVNGSLAFPAGRWTFDRLDTLRGTTNSIVDVSGYSDGTIVQVDINGWQTVNAGVDLRGPATYGFVTALMTVGFALLFRYLFRRVSEITSGSAVE